MNGIKASELIKLLKESIEEYGDREVITGGTDYPSGVCGVTVEEYGNPYIPKGSLVITVNNW